MLQNFSTIYQLLCSTEKRQLLTIVFISVVDACFNVVGIASILPFISLVSEPEIYSTSEYVQSFIQITGVSSYAGVVLSFAVISFLLILLSNAFGAFAQWYSAAFSLQKESSLGQKLLSNYLKLDALAFNKKTYAERAKSILVDIDRIVIDTLFSLIDLFSNFVVAVLIFALLLVIDFTATFVITACLGGVYFIVYFLMSDKLDRLGDEFTQLEGQLYDDVLGSFPLYKEIKLANLQRYFVDRYSNRFSKAIDNQLLLELLSIIPKHVVEIAAFGCILVIASYFAIYTPEGYSLVTIVGVYAFAAYRLAPAISDIFESFEKVRYSAASLKPLVKSISIKNDDIESSSIKLIQQSIRFDNVEFEYEGSSEFAIRNLNIFIEAKKFNCVTGRTGCGKTTFLNILMGLYYIPQGKTLVDEREVILFNNQSWQGTLGFVSSITPMIETSLLENITLTDRLEDTDQERLDFAIEVSMFDSVLAKLPNGLESEYGSRDITLSSGQMQLLGLARALYRYPQILILDEFSNSLDALTEKSVLLKLKQNFPGTIVFVTHRASVLPFADNIIELEKLL